MIKSFKHRGLKALHENGVTRWVSPRHVEKLRDLLAVLDQSRVPDDLKLPGLRLHQLRGRLKGHYAVSVSGNWRVSFRFDKGHAADVDFIDYH
ncbi:MAG: type II toxin-antitoxin system RelE/ParE family toxin [Gemmatimonadetes bacterium]|nr:type II toxin-antitoxin system RelE/ParE family toxin [Gemmatimonadota bacterium]